MLHLNTPPPKIRATLTTLYIRLRGEAKFRVDFGLIYLFIKFFYGIGNTVWKFQVSTMKIVPVARIWNSFIHIMMTQHFRKGDNIW